MKRIGFYSGFIVASKVEVISRRAGEAPIEPDRELLALGVASVAGSFFHCASVGSLSHPRLSWRRVDVRDNGLDLHQVLADLGTAGVNELHVEAGPLVSGAFLSAGLVDELLLYLAPVLLGSGRPLAAVPTPSNLIAVKRMQWVDQVPVGQDLRCRLRPVVGA